jgi:hypothetical protein
VQAIKLELKSLDGSLITVQLVAIISHNRPDRVLVRHSSGKMTYQDLTRGSTSSSVSVGSTG